MSNNYIFWITFQIPCRRDTVSVLSCTKTFAAWSCCLNNAASSIAFFATFLASSNSPLKFIYLQRYELHDLRNKKYCIIIILPLNRTTSCSAWSLFSRASSKSSEKLQLNYKHIYEIGSNCSMQWTSISQCKIRKTAARMLCQLLQALMRPLFF